MNYAELVRDAWAMTTQYGKLKWFIFVPSFMGVVLFGLEVLWQLFMYLEEWGYLEIDILQAAANILDFVIDNGLIFWIFIFGLLLFIFGYVLPSWVAGVLIFSAQQMASPENKYLSLRQKMVQATSIFFQFSELRALTGIFSPWTVMLFSATLYRYHHDGLFKIIWPFLLIYGIFCIIFSFFTIFAEHFIAFVRSGVIQSLRQSLFLVFLNLGSTLIILFIMLLVNFRVILNVLIILGVPLIVLWIFTYFSNNIVQGIGVVLAIILVAFAAYLTAILEIFSTAVWTKSFLRFQAHQKELQS